MKTQTLSLTFILCLFLPAFAFAQFPNLRSVSDFALFTTTGAVGNTGVSVITGKIGTNDGAITAFTFIPGQEENANLVTSQAALDLQLAYDEIFLASPTFPPHAPVLGNGDTLLAGVYIIPEAASIVGTLILDAQGDPTAKFIFKIGGAFSPGPSSQIILTGGALACNVYWAVEGGAIAIATLANMKGNFIANPGAVSIAATGTVEGRLLSTTGAIAVDGSIVALPICGIILPVSLISFRATKKDSGIELIWTVENEISFAGYDIERSEDGLIYTRIATLPSTSATTLKTYQWMDNSPFPTSNFYRLKMRNLDNGFKYSNVLKITMSARKGLQVYPNPVVGHNLVLQMYGQARGSYNLELFNLAGEKVMPVRTIIHDFDAVTSINLDPNLSTGIYFLQLTGPKNMVETIRILIQ